MSWLAGSSGKKEEAPPEPLVLGAELRCMYGSEHSYLLVWPDSMRLDVNGLPVACVKDCIKNINITPFGNCWMGGTCEQLMELDKQWANAEPQNTFSNGNEIITTKSTLMCMATTMEIEVVTSGQDGVQAARLTEQLALFTEINTKYPGLLAILLNPDGSLYLQEGMYQKAIQFLGDCVDKHGGEIDMAVLYTGSDIEAQLMRAALGHLVPSCDATRPDQFVEILEVRGTVNDMNGVPGWDARLLNKEMLNMLEKDCAATAERIDTKSYYKWQEEYKQQLRFFSEMTQELAFFALLYLNMTSEQIRRYKQNTAEAPAEGVTEGATERATEGVAERATEGATEGATEAVTEGAVESDIETSYGKSSLKFGDNDLVYGPSANGKLVELQKSAGGKLLSDVGNPYDMGYGSDWLKFSTDTIENTVKQGNYIHFDLTNMQDIDGILNGTSQYMNRTTSGELRYIRDNWDRLSGNVKFYNNGKEVLPPWMN